MRRLAAILPLVCIAALAGQGHARPTAPPASAPSPFPGGLSPQWLNAANVDPVACLAALQATGAKYRVLPPQDKPDRKGCGVPHGVLVMRGPSGIAYTPPLWVDCSFATELASIEGVIQDEARDQLHTSIRGIDTLGAYVCVTRAGPFTTRYATKPAISEHSFGLAFDLRAFTPARGREITVLKDYEKGTDTPAQPRGTFLHNVAVRLKRETGLTHVLTPDFDADHANHFHLDRGLPFGWWWRIHDPSG
jgi:hypothetical protein